MYKLIYFYKHTAISTTQPQYAYQFSISDLNYAYNPILIISDTKVSTAKVVSLYFSWLG